jgi:hypothetical protein
VALTSNEDGAISNSPNGDETAKPEIDPVFREPKPDPVPGPSNAELRAWAKRHGIKMSPKGRIPSQVLDDYLADQDMVKHIRERHGAE